MLGINLQKFYSVCLMIILLAGAVAAQSGRKANKTTTMQTQTGQPPSGNEKSAAETKNESVSADLPPPAIPKTALRIAVDIPQSLYFQFPYPENMGRWVFDRLSRSPALDVGMMGDKSNRGQVIKHAKNETQNLSVLLELEDNNGMQGSASRSRAQNGDIWINYYIYLPGTGKLKSQGRAYLGQSSTLNRRSSDILGISCYPGVRGDNLLLLRASIEIADRIMSDLSVRIPPVCASGS